MKKIIFLLCMGVVTLSSCKKEEPLKEPLNLSAALYDLPQQGASEEANRKILEIYEKYGSYFLYDFTDKDAFYTLVAGGGSGAGNLISDVVSPAKLEFVEDMLYLLEESWLRYNPKVPLRVFLADSLGNWDPSRPLGTNYSPERNLYRPIENSIIFARVNETLPAHPKAGEEPSQAWKDKVLEYTKVFFPFPLAMPDDANNKLPEFWTLSVYGTGMDQKLWRAGSGDFDNGSYVQGGTLYESILPGGTANLNITSATVNYNYKPRNEDAAANVTGSYNGIEARLRINQAMATMGFVPQYAATGSDNPQIYATPFGPVNMLANWDRNNHEYLRSYEIDQLRAWVWAPQQVIDDSGWFDDTYPILKQKFDMIVEAYNDAGLDVRHAADPDNVPAMQK